MDCINRCLSAHLGESELAAAAAVVMAPLTRAAAEPATASARDLAACPPSLAARLAPHVRDAAASDALPPPFGAREWRMHAGCLSMLEKLLLEAHATTARVAASDEAAAELLAAESARAKSARAVRRAPAFFESADECDDGGVEVCASCRAAPPSVLFEPCMHVCLCAECAPEAARGAAHCPVCGVRASHTYQVFL